MKAGGGGVFLKCKMYDRPVEKYEEEEGKEKYHHSHTREVDLQ